MFHINCLFLLFLALTNGLFLEPLHPKFINSVLHRRIEESLHNEKGRIVGGHEAVPHSYPHQVGMFIDGNAFCGGSLIDRQWVVTAAHCVRGAESANVILGAHRIFEDEPTQLKISATEFIVHEKYNSSLTINDIALIKFPHPIEYTNEIKAVSLPKNDEPVGTVMTATGWGFTSQSSSSIARELREVDAETLEVELCESIYGEKGGETVICINGIGGVGICNGDSGGPLYHKGKIYGITSYGPGLGCESGFPQGFTRITSYLDWIESKSGVKPSE